MIDKTHGLVAAPFTPFHPDGSLAADTIDAYADHLVRDGVIGAFVCGTTGESASLTLAERMQVAERWIAAAPAGFRVFVSVSSTCLADCRTLAEHAESVGARGIACLAPYFFRPEGVAGMVDWCRQIAAAAPRTPFYFYHFPTITGFSMRVEEFLDAAASAVPTLAGVKFTFEDIDDFAAAVRSHGGRFDVLFGRDEKLLDALDVGARGAVGSTYNFAAPLYRRLIDARERGDHEAARALQATAVRMIEACAATGGGLAAFKGMMGRIGIDCGPVRAPLRPLPPGTVRHLDAILEQAGILDASAPLPG